MIQVTYPLTPKAWSFSSIELYKLCPRKYEGERLTKEVEFTDTEATIYGTDCHKAFEDGITHGLPMPDRFAFCQPLLDMVLRWRGEKYAEMKLGAKTDSNGVWVTCDFFDPDCEIRGVADVVVLSGTTARVIDWKTGSAKSFKYAKPAQLLLMAFLLYLKYPHLTLVKGALIFVAVKDGVIRQEYSRDDAVKIMAFYGNDLIRRMGSYNTGIFNPNPNPLCKKWCGVLSCVHNGQR